MSHAPRLTVTPATQPLADTLAILDRWHAGVIQGLELRERLDAAEDLCAVAYVTSDAPVPQPLKALLKEAWQALEGPTEKLLAAHGPYPGAGDADFVGAALERWGESVRDAPPDGPALAEAKPWLAEIVRIAACTAACLARRYPHEGWQRGAELLEEIRRSLTPTT